MTKSPTSPPPPLPSHPRVTGAAFGLLLLFPLALAACHHAPPPSPAATTGQAAAPAAAAEVAATTAATAPATVAATTTAPADRHGYAEADVQFMQHMIGHHAQALAMTALVPSHSTREDVHLLAERIRVTQRDEITLMRRWLAEHHEAEPPPAFGEPPSSSSVAAHGGGGGDSAAAAPAMAHDMAHDMASMPGMSMSNASKTSDSSAMSMMMPGMLTPAEFDQLAHATGPAFDQLFVRYMIRHHEGALTMVARYFATPGAGQEAAAFRFVSDVDADQRAEIARMRALQRTLPPAGPGGAPPPPPQH